MTVAASETAPLAVAILDDEPLARRRLERLLAREAGVVLAGSFEHPLDARVALSSGGAVGEVDLLLLDIEMPGGNGFAMLDGWPGQRPYVIVVTAHAGHAVPAFQQEAVDFLLKPYDDESFVRAIERARRRLRADAALAGATSPSATPAGAADAAPSGMTLKIAVPAADGLGTTLLAPASVLWLKSAGHEVLLLSEGHRYAVPGRLGDFAKRLAPLGFLRVHRGTLVNSTLLRGWKPLGHGDGELLLEGGERVVVSRRYAAALRARLL